MNLASLQPAIMVSKENISKNELTSENMYLPLNLEKRAKTKFKLFKIGSHNPKFNLQYLMPNKV